MASVFFQIAQSIETDTAFRLSRSVIHFAHPSSIALVSDLGQPFKFGFVDDRDA
jgi:hypothetical protein